MAAPPAYLDECIDYSITALLQRRGFDVRHVYDEQTTGDDDEKQLEYATKNGWVFVTQNQWEFRRRHQTWQQQGRLHSGLVLTPQHPDETLVELRIAMLLSWIAVRPLAPSFLVRWSELQFELTHGYRHPTYSEAEVQRAIGRSPRQHP